MINCVSSKVTFKSSIFIFSATMSKLEFSKSPKYVIYSKSVSNSTFGAAKKSGAGLKSGLLDTVTASSKS